ncbi:MAG: hypothetical protein IJ343_02690 [Clostridia bacterium]|nr:hypothetical protein [Clostridia bacterium]
MLLFCTTLPLREETTKRECVQLLADWVCGSQFYPIEQIDVDKATQEDFEFQQDGFTYLITHYLDQQADVTACRLENFSNNMLWLSECTYVDTPGNKRLLIQVKCSRSDYSSQLTVAHTPHIVRQFVDSGLCRIDDWLPISSEPVRATMDNLPAVADMMMGRSRNDLPVIYISTDGWDLPLNPEITARNFCGLAHVIVEEDTAVSQQLKQLTRGKNAYGGYIALHMPHSSLRYLFHRGNYHNARALNDGIRRTLMQCLINRWNPSDYSWEQIRAKQNRQRLEQELSQNRSAFEEWFTACDAEDKALHEKIGDLTRQLEKADAEINRLRAQLPADGKRSFFFQGVEPELITGEYNDLLLSMLNHSRTLYADDSRARLLIDSMLASTHRVGDCARIMTEVKRIFSPGEALKSSSRSDLEHLGFCFIEGTKTHVKMYFRHPRYQFTYPTSPSDVRGGKNMVSEIRGRLDVEKKI